VNAPSSAAGGRHQRARQRRFSPKAVRGMLVALAVVLVLGGGALLWTGFHGNGNAHANFTPLGSIPSSEPSTPAPSSSAPSSSAAPSTTSSGSCSGGNAHDKPAAATPMDASRPVAVRIPCIGVDSTHMMKLGLNSDGTIQVPPLLSGRTGWYKQSPTPGQKGPAIILGHIDSYKGPSVFFHLDEVKPGEQVIVTRADGTKAHFTVDAIKQYSKKDFPTKKVYGNVSYPALRLITCGGQFNEQKRSYESDTVVYAHLTQPAGSSD
jgi:hypothetical protein